MSVTVENNPGLDTGALYAALTGYLSGEEVDAMATAAQRLIAAAGQAGIENYKVMVAYGGGKDSTYVVAFVRAVQLKVLMDHGRTFTLRVANMRHAGVPWAVMANIDRVYRALGLLDDPMAELLTVDHTQVRRFHRDLPLPDSLRDINRVDMLMNGHRSAGDGRPTFCNSCNLAVADFYGRAAWWDGGVDVVFTGDSRREQLLYSAWILKLAKRSGIDVEECRRMGFRGLLAALRSIGDAYFRELFGDESCAELAEREVSAGDRSAQPVFISIYDLVSYRVNDHWDLIVDFLGFEFDDLAFNFTESDCANPMLMAHLRGLRAEYVQDRTYEDGIRDYLQMAGPLLVKKEIPEDLRRLALDRYDSTDKIAVRRDMADGYARDAYGVGEEALVAMVFSPFCDQGARLVRFLERCHPGMAAKVDDLHAALRCDSDDSSAVTWLEGVSALPIRHLRTLYRSTLVDFTTEQSMMARVRAGDPHKIPVEIADRSGARSVEIISGR
ncbi:hypothetical protein NCC78_10675 [Micromonospora phytophila]|uniref:hypothetical protein n=1 Tax=Micromonospora phytophila TaxID=709888 RepID=UPI00202F639C|nr:hypothetical protein [Micromonospora phytophila]MCM0675150.1 hypothetical protein [Micromonospora phytophila]